KITNDAFSRRRESSEAFANGGSDSGDGKSVDRFLGRKSDAAGAASDRGRSAGRILRNDAGVNPGRTRSENRNVLSAERGERFADAHGDNPSERSANRRTTRSDGRKIDYGNANSGGFGSGDKTSRAEGCESARRSWQRRTSAQSRGSAATGQAIRRN